MSEENKKPKIIFAPGVLEQLEAENTPEELQELFDSLSAGFADGSIFDKSTPVDLEELEQSDPELFTHLMEQMSKINEDGEFDQPTVH
ncbi:MAG: hypothetical protein EO766_11765 [Hydrotalea sp. AMD]|uniref:hypothetical protein n=1 Tax=Hydrotalea sp. AMD TaxID=2501297 RepID=UPI001024E408|nr:hypothetical protein [Hydrotalea sp. AMD]RWZ87201.1 MAG: hypothetical protein EO766_11765 [Hydrotalea sp. AMD]